MRWTCLLLLAAATLDAQPAARPRARDIGLAPGVFAAGPLNAITDVAGVTVGHATLVEGDAVRTGVTVIVPHQGNVFQDKVPGAVFVGNAFGKLAGSTQVEELGTIETPVALTNTLSVGAAVEGLVRWTLAQAGNGDVRSVNALVGETNDGGLNDIRGLHVRPDHVLEALKAARPGRVEEGSVGAGTGTEAFGWKGGIGTSSRRLAARFGGYTVGVLVQTNFGGVLTMGGAPIGKLLGRRYSVTAEPAPDEDRAWRRLLHDRGRHGCAVGRARVEAAGRARGVRPWADGLVVQQRQRRFCDRFLHGAGPAHAVRRRRRRRHGRCCRPTACRPLFEAALEATEEAVYNSLLQATTVTSRFGTAEALPIERVREILKRYPQP